MAVLARREDGLEIDDDPGRLDLGSTCDLVVRQGYWAQDRSREVVAATLASSWCFGVYDGDRQIAFARAVTDRATFAWVCDVVVDEARRGAGIGHWFMDTVTATLAGAIDGWLLLRTRDAHQVYRDVGWTDLSAADRWMEILPGTYAGHGSATA